MHMHMHMRMHMHMFWSMWRALEADLGRLLRGDVVALRLDLLALRL